MSDELKSAYEIAMEKLRARGGDGPDEAALTDEQKEQIAAVRAEFRARRAETQILHGEALQAARASGDPERLGQLEEEHSRDLQRLADREEEQVAAIRRGESGKR
jgi:hypothetical protein